MLSFVWNFSNFTIFDPKICFNFFYKSVKYKINALTEFELMACGLVVCALNHCATPLGNNLWKENTSKTILDFMVYFYGKYITIRRCPIYVPLKQTIRNAFSNVIWNSFYECWPKLRRQ